MCYLDIFDRKITKKTLNLPFIVIFSIFCHASDVLL